MGNVRFTAYISEREREGIEATARKNGTSSNFVVRTAIRNLLGLPSQLLRVTPVTEDEKESANA